MALLRHQLVANLDAALSTRLDDLADLTDRGALPTTLTDTGGDGTVVQVVGARGRGGGPEPEHHRPRLAPAPGRAGRGDGDRDRPPHPAGDASAYRVAGRRATGGVTLLAGASTEPTDEAAGALRKALRAAVPALVALVGALIWWVVGRALAPVETLRRTLDRISMAVLDQRVPEPAVSDEIGRLARTMNGMLARLDAASSRQRAFVADASHELRTPLASVLAQLEWPRWRLPRATRMPPTGRRPRDAWLTTPAV